MAYELTENLFYAVINEFILSSTDSWDELLLHLPQELIEERKQRPENTEKRLKIPWKRQIETKIAWKQRQGQRAIRPVNARGFNEG